MYIYWISYRIHEDSSYAARYNDLIDRIDQVSLSQWDETTSFHIIKSDYSIDQISTHLVVPLKERVDTLVIRKMNYRDARYFGNDSDFLSLKSFIPYVKRG